MFRRVAIAVPLLMAGIALASAAYSASFEVSQAKLNGSQLTFNVNAPEAGWAVIHLEEDGKAGAVIAHAKIQKGRNEKVSVPLSQSVEDGDTLIVMLHEDKSRPSVFEFGALGKADSPAMNNGTPITAEITPK